MAPRKQLPPADPEVSQCEVLSTEVPVVPPLPNWRDPASVISYLTSISSLVVGVIALLHPGFVEPSAVQALIPSVGFLVAGVAQIVNVVYHRKAQIAAITKA